jgi:Holliday junction resolvasome RuvABC endonuclease subunit
VADKKNTFIIGIDSSIAFPAMSLHKVENGKPVGNITYGFPQKKKPGDPKRGTRHRKIVEMILATVVNHLSAVDLGNTNLVLVIEHFAMNAKGRICDLAELIGMIKMTLIMRFDFDVIYEVPPTTLKKFTTGHGFADKAQMAEAIERDYGKKFPDDNQVDAFALACLADFLWHEKQEGSRDHRKLTKKIQTF